MIACTVLQLNHQSCPAISHELLTKCTNITVIALLLPMSDEYRLLLGIMAVAPQFKQVNCLLLQRDAYFIIFKIL